MSNDASLPTSRPSHLMTLIHPTTTAKGRVLRLAAVVLVGILAGPVYAQSIFFNDVNYDPGTTANPEYFAIAGPAGTDLTGYKVYLYDAAGNVQGSPQVFGARSVSDDQNGYGVEPILSSVTLPDATTGLALTTPTDDLVQFVSYEGSVTAVDGPALGTTSTDLGTDPGESAGTDQTLQLIGTGNTFDDFTVAVQAIDFVSPVNQNQAFQDPAVTLATADGSIGENGGSTTVTVAITDTPPVETVVTLALDNATDASLSSTTVTFEANTTSLTRTVTLSGVDDADSEGDEDVNVSISSLSTTYATVGTPSSATVTITDDESSTIAVSPTSLTVSETGTTATFDVTLSRAPTADVTVAVASSDVSEATVSTPTLTFTSAGPLTQTVTVTGVDDAVNDGDVTFDVTLAAAASADLGFDGVDPDDVTVTVTDDESPPPAGTTLAQGDIAIVAADAADEQFSFVLLTDVGAGTVIRFSDIDLLAGGGTSEDNGGDGTGDGIAEVTLSALPAGTVVTVNLLGPTLADAGQGTVEITNTGFLLSTFGDSIVAYQGGSDTTPTGGTYLYYVELDDGNSQAPASLGADAVFDDGGDGFAYDTRDAGAGAPTAGTTAGLIAAFNNAANYAALTADFDPSTYLPTSFTILAQDPSVFLAVNPSSVAEAGGTATITATLSSAADGDVTVTLNGTDAFGGTAQIGSDFSLSPTTITIASGTTVGTATLTAIDDGVEEEDERADVYIASVSGNVQDPTCLAPPRVASGEKTLDGVADAQVGLSCVVFVTIQDDDGEGGGTPVEDDAFVEFESVQQGVSEDAGAAILTLSVSEAPDEDTDVTVTLVSGDPADLGGFTSETVTFSSAIGSPTEIEVEVPVTDDFVAEDAESFTFSLSVEDDGEGDPALVVGTRSLTTLVVADNDGEPASASVPPRDADGDGVEDGGLRLLSLPVNGVTAGDLADQAGADVVYVLGTDGFVAADPASVIGAGQPVLVDVAPGSELAFDGTAPSATATFPAITVDLGDDDRALFAVGNPTGGPVDFEDITVAGGTLADVVLVFDPVSGAFRPVSLSGLGDVVLGANDVVVVQVVPDGDAGDVSVSVPTAYDEDSDGDSIADAEFAGGDDETTVVLTLSPAAGETGRRVQASEPGDTVALRFLGDAEEGLDPFDGVDLESPYGGTLAAAGPADAPFAALAQGALTFGEAVAVPLVVDVPSAGSYELALASDLEDVDGRPVVVEILDGGAPVALADGTPYTFSVSDGEDLDGRFSVRVSLGPGVDAEDEADGRLSLALFPNPSAGRVTVELAVPSAGDVRVSVHDALGREVAVVHDGPVTEGVRMDLPAGRLAPGAYLVRAAGEGFVEVRSLTVVR